MKIQKEALSPAKYISMTLIGLIKSIQNPLFGVKIKFCKLSMMSVIKISNQITILSYYVEHLHSF